LARDDAVTLCWAGFALARVAGDLDAGLAHIDRALALNPSLAAAWNFSGRVRVYRGDHELAIGHLAQAMRLSPLDPLLFSMQGSTAFAHFFLGYHEEACDWAEKARRENPNFLPVLAITAASNALAGRMEAARGAVERLRTIDPALRISTLSDHTPIRRPEDLAKYAEALRQAGLPD
jgi:tetratricopeptide (TPR) repeat protein